MIEIITHKAKLILRTKINSCNNFFYFFNILFWIFPRRVQKIKMWCACVQARARDGGAAAAAPARVRALLRGARPDAAAVVRPPAPLERLGAVLRVGARP